MHGHGPGSKWEVRRGSAELRKGSGDQIPIIARCTVGFEEAELGYANNREEMSRMRGSDLFIQERITYGKALIELIRRSTKQSSSHSTTESL